MWRRQSAWALAFISLWALSACGGGGGGAGSSATTSTETFQLRTALVNSLTDTQALTFSISGTSSGYPVTGDGTVTQGALTSTTFESQQALQKIDTITGSFTANGITIPLATSSTSYLDSNHNPLGESEDSSYTVVSGSVTMPTTAHVNDTGILYTAVRYASSAKTTQLGTETASFAMEPDTFSTALLKVITVERDTANNVTSTTTVIFRITPAGGFTRISETFIDDTDTFRLTY